MSENFIQEEKRKREFDRLTVKREKVTALEPFLNFLFVVYNEIEMEEMEKNLTPLDGYGVILDYIEEDCLQHFFIGKFFKYNIVLAKTSDMGQKDVNSVINVINRAIQIFRPNYIIMPGISAGLDDKLQIGDVVIADKIIGYESKKIAPTEIIGRYPEYRSPRLFNLFCSANVKNFNVFLKREIQKELNEELTKKGIDKPDCKKNCPKNKNEDFSWNAFVSNNGFPEVHTGNYISGDKLLDNSFYRCYLKSEFQEAAALDMEGLGVATASIFNRVYDWLVIKGISDFGDGNKGKDKTARQHYAMKNVILTLKKVFDDELSFSESNLKQVRGNNRKNVLISGSQCDADSFAGITEIFVQELAKQLIVNKYNVISGYGLNVGPAVLFGVFDGCDQIGLSSQEYMYRFQTFPFPRMETDDPVYETKLERYKIKNREVLCSSGDIAIFVFGNKERNVGNSYIADGMYEELNLVAKNKGLIVPVGCTGGTARQIYEKILTERNNYIKPYFCERNKYCDPSSNVDEDIDNYFKHLKKLNKLTLEKGNVAQVVQKVIELINLYG